MKEQHAHGHWGKFTDAVTVLDTLVRQRKLYTPTTPAEAGVFEAYTAESCGTWDILAGIFSTAIRFYVPGAATAVLNGGMLRHPIRLPYELVALLVETPNSITGAFTLIIATRATREGESANGDIMFWAASLTPTGWAWSPLTWVASLNPECMYAPKEQGVLSAYAGTVSKHICEFNFDNMPKDEYVVYPILSKSHIAYIEATDIDIAATMACAVEYVHALATFCALLEVHDVETPVVSAPSKLQASRTKNGKVPLYDYRVLRIGGETWDTPYVSSGTGEGRRSHLRRGHIRRLESKTVWVRATYVHGSKDGFLHKDYEVIPPQKGYAHAVQEQGRP